jgi:predicted Zn-dependent protease
MHRITFPLLLAIGHAACAPLAHASTRALISESQVLGASARQFEELKKNNIAALDKNFASKATCIANALIKAIPAEKQILEISWSVHVFEDPSPNASTFPTGHIVINSGLGAVAKNQDEIAAAISSPIASALLSHTHKKINRRMEAQVLAMPNGMSPLQQHAFDKRETEIAAQEAIDADDLGRQLAAAAGFAPEGSLVVLEALAGKQPKSKLLYEPRVAAARAWLESNTRNSSAPSKPCSAALQ